MGLCGIAGAVRHAGEASPTVVERQLRCLSHRGPDAVGVFAAGAGAIGQTRLAVIDLETGDPPVTDEAGSIGAVLNGEIYNFRTLRERLRAEGHNFRTSGDTEVLAHLAETLEPVEMARALDGMFAFAVWDERRGRLVLGRDRLGKKPLYYHYSPGGLLVFGSEIKSLLAHPAVPRRFETEMLGPYLTFGYIPTPQTIFEGVRSLPPGHVLVFEQGAAPAEIRYWRLPVPGLDGIEPLSITFEEAAREVRACLGRSVERRLVSDVPLGAFLSGGIDSSAIVALMSERTDHQVRTFSIGFEDQDGYDERAYARLVARRFETDHTEFVVKPDAVDLVERLVWHHDQPFGDNSAIPTFLLAELTRSHVTVALSGDGGDELFAGYERFAAGVAVERYLALGAPMRGLLRRLVEAAPPSLLSGRAGRVHRFVRRADLGMPDAYREWISYVPDEWRRRLLPSGSIWGLEDYARRWDRTSSARTLDRLLALNIETYLLDDLLIKVDRMSMAHGLEVRSPFLDTELVEFAALLPPEWKMRGLTLKRCLKAAMSGLLPEKILRRRKRGFGVPLDRWFRQDLAGYAEDALGGGNSRLRELLCGDAIDAMLAEHASERANHAQGLWTLLTLEVFLRQQGW